MVKKGLTYVVQRIKQIIVYTLFLVTFVALCCVSISQAKNQHQNSSEKQATNINSADSIRVMQILLSPEEDMSEICNIDETPPEIGKCKPIFNIDENVLQDLLNNYTTCFNEDSAYINLSTRAAITLTKPLRIFGRKEKPLTIKGLSLVPAVGFHLTSPAIIIYGEAVNISDVHLDGFENGIVYASEDNTKHKISGGSIKTLNFAKQAITACENAPTVTDIDIEGYEKPVCIIKSQSTDMEGEKVTE